jgi:hypothetical protein
VTSQVDLLRDLYRPAPPLPRAQLQDLADSLQAQLVRLSEDPTPDLCETVARNLDGARQAILRMRQSLLEAGRG